ncbi:MAG: sigma-54-dependent Fis family transcriptional regulator [Marinilabiliales bacterium]|nr:MAG: sigma-54-dependent Fis family transcriptional regulator [Marinilabiliales bacterium]
MSKGNILVVDDNRNVLLAIEMLLSQEFDRVSTISSPNLLISELRQNQYNLVLLDMNFKSGANTGNEGIYWLQRIREDHPDISVVLMTAYGDVELAVRALKAGATDFVLKPWDNTKLLATVRSAIQLNLSRKEIKDLRQREKELKTSINRHDKEIIGSSKPFAEMLKTVEKVAATDTNVLITGENGTGKELIARRIHRLSGRSQELMVSVDMGAVSETLFESELFGHVKGAFTDARDNRTGRIELADKGTLFLDEIANLPLSLQPKLLAALQNRVITRVGSNETVPVDIRLISATNRNPARLVAEGLFREDLLYRINTIGIEIPPLRSRTSDIPLLAGHFLEKYSEKYGKKPIEISGRAMERMVQHSWPGNVRELEHTVEKAVILNESGSITENDLFSGTASGYLPDPGDTLNLVEIEKRVIMTAIEKNQGNIKAAAGQLGITRQTLYNKMQKYGIG